MRSLAGRIVPKHNHTVLVPLFLITEVFVIPVRHILPESLCSGELDYSAIVSAILILLSGLGIEQIIMSLVNYLS